MKPTLILLVLIIKDSVDQSQQLDIFTHCGNEQVPEYLEFIETRLSGRYYWGGCVPRADAGWVLDEVDGVCQDGYVALSGRCVRESYTWTCDGASLLKSQRCGEKRPVCRSTREVEVDGACEVAEEVWQCDGANQLAEVPCQGGCKDGYVRMSSSLNGRSPRGENSLGADGCVKEYLVNLCGAEDDADGITNLGRRRAPGIKGCECSRELGFIEGNDGHCHLEYFQGPCQEGEQLVQDSQGAQCRHNNCTQGYLLLDMGHCYLFNCTVSVFHGLPLTEREKLLLPPHGACTYDTTSLDSHQDDDHSDYYDEDEDGIGRVAGPCTFCTPLCPVRAQTDGTCLATAPGPTEDEQGLLKRAKKLFNKLLEV